MDESLKPPVAERLRAARKAIGLAQGALAGMIGMKQQAIAEIERGKVARPKKLRELAAALGRSEEWLLGEVPFDSEPRKTPSMPATNAGSAVSVSIPRSRVPILGQGVGGQNGRFVLNGTKIGDVFCPPFLENVPDVYAVFVHGDSMEPRYFPGELVWTHPHAPIKQGDFVVVQIKPDERGDDPYGYIKRYVSWDFSKLVLEQLNPPETLLFPTPDVIYVHKIVFSGQA